MSDIKHSPSEKSMTRRELLQMAVPRGVFPKKGYVVLDQTKCSVCTLCAAECPTGALAAVGDESVRLIFRHELCNSCGQCIRVCPEECLQLKANGNEVSPIVLLENEFVYCKNCGAIIGSRSMVEMIRSKLSSKDESITGRLEFCPACKMRERTETQYSK